MTKGDQVRLRDRVTGAAKNVEVKGHVSWLDSRSLLVATTPLEILDAKTLEARSTIAAPDTTVRFTALHPSLTWVIGALNDQLYVAAPAPVR